MTPPDTTSPVECSLCQRTQPAYATLTTLTAAHPVCELCWTNVLAHFILPISARVASFDADARSWTRWTQIVGDEELAS